MSANGRRAVVVLAASAVGAAIAAIGVSVFNGSTSGAFSDRHSTAVSITVRGPSTPSTTDSTTGTRAPLRSTGTTQGLADSAPAATEHTPSNNGSSHNSASKNAASNGAAPPRNSAPSNGAAHRSATKNSTPTPNSKAGSAHSTGPELSATATLTLTIEGNR